MKYTVMKMLAYLSSRKSNSVENSKNLGKLKQIENASTGNT